MPASDLIYRPADPAGPLRQGEILSDLKLYRLDHSTVAEDEPTLLRVTYPFVVIVSQDCDLTQHGVGSSTLPTILALEVAHAATLRGGENINSAAWNGIKQNRDERYHFLQAVPQAQDSSGVGLGELGLDFKRYLAVPTDEFYSTVRTGLGTRRCVLNSPYMEHLCRRFGNYFTRVARPEPHFSS